MINAKWKERTDMEAGSSRSNPICLDDSSDDSDDGDKSEASPPKQADKNHLLGRLHAERLDRRRQLHTERLAGRESAGTSSGDQTKESIAPAAAPRVMPNVATTTAMKKVRGDLIDLALKGHFDVIVHGCNCLNAMGAGIALTIKKVFPEAYAADCKTSRGERNKLGTISSATVRRNGRDITIVNAYTQYHWRGEGVLTEYDALRSAFRHVKAEFSGRRMAYPLIGAGLAKGDWNRIERIINEELAGEDHCLVEYSSSKRKK